MSSDLNDGREYEEMCKAFAVGNKAEAREFALKLLENTNEGVYPNIENAREQVIAKLKQVLIATKPEKEGAKMSQDFQHEWHESEERVRRESETMLTELGASRELMQYALSGKGAMTWPFLATLWGYNTPQRSDLDVAFSLHMLGVKIFDDILDEDIDFPVAELAVSVPLIQTATSQMCQHHNARKIHTSLKSAYTNIWKWQRHELAHRPSSFLAWQNIAEVKAGELLGCYSRIASLAVNREQWAETSYQFGKALGMILMVRDDAIDYTTRGDRRGNLVHMLLKNRFSFRGVSKLLEENVIAAEQAASCLPFATDAMSVSGVFVADTTERYAAYGFK